MFNQNKIFVGLKYIFARIFHSIKSSDCSEKGIFFGFLSGFFCVFRKFLILFLRKKTSFFGGANANVLIDSSHRDPTVCFCN